MRSRATVQSAAGFANQHLQRAGLRTRLQDGGYKYRIHPAETALGLTDADLVFGFEFGEVERYGAVGDDATDCADAIQTACEAMNEAGGGEVLFGPYVYRLTDLDTGLVVVPVSAANYQPATELHQFHVRMVDTTGVSLRGRGTVLKSIVTNGGEMILLDGVRDFKMSGITMRSVYAHDGAGATTTTGMHGVAMTAQNRDSFNLVFERCASFDTFVALYCFGDGASASRVRGVTVNGLRHEGGRYTLAFHNNGDNLTARGVQSVNVLREYFTYGVTQSDVSAWSKTGVAGFGSLIKAYDYDTVGVKFRLVTLKNISAANVSIQSQHVPTVQAVPGRVIGYDIEVINKGAVGYGVAVDHRYFADPASPATVPTDTAVSAANLFDGGKLSGIHEQAPTFGVVQAVVGTLNTDDVLLLNGSMHSIYSRGGFRDTKQTYATAAVVVKINGSAVGITQGASTLEFWRDGQFIEALYNVILTSKGAGVGAVTLDLPVQSSTANAGNSIVNGFAAANVATISGALSGIVANAGTTLSLVIQGANGANNLTDVNLTNTSVLRLHIRYPI